MVAFDSPFARPHRVTFALLREFDDPFSDQGTAGSLRSTRPRSCKAASNAEESNLDLIWTEGVVFEKPIDRHGG
jgi:hypothetical protein